LGCLGQTEVQNLSFFNQLFDGVCHILDWHIRIDPVLVVEINAGFGFLRRFSDSSTTFGYALLAVKSAALLVVEAELRCDTTLSRKGAMLLDKLFGLYKGRKLRLYRERDALSTSGAMT